MLRSAFLFATLAVMATPAAAASYSARLAAPANSHIVAREINWACAADSCQGATAESRPAVLCQALAKKAGKIESFAVDGRAFTSAEVAKCNAAVKADAGKALAAQ